MAVISNINNAYNVNSGKTHKKLSFELGEKISARIINIDGETSEAILKLLDGWQFSAQIKDAMDFTPNKLIRFEVEGYDNGKIVLKVLNEAEEKIQQSLIDILEEQGINVKEEDYNILQKMIKYNMPLTKENISKMKTLLEFQGKINESTNEENQFIERYLTNKNISLSSEEGQNIKNTLKGFFSEFKKLSTDEIFTLIQSNIELTEENIKSFNNINKGSMAIYEDIVDDNSILENFDKLVKPEELEEVNNNGNTNSIDLSKDENLNNTSNKNNVYNSKIYSNDSNVMDGKEILRRLLETDVEDNNNDIKQNDIKESVKDNKENVQKDTSNSVTNNLEKESINLDGDKIKKVPQNNENKNVSSDDNTNSNLENEEVQIKENNQSGKKITVDKLNNKLVETSEKVKEELNNKINDMKEIIKHALGENKDGKSTLVDKVFQNLQTKINDFKVFNSLSNQYYYLDVPVNVNEREYPCKLIIKDDRKDGKKIDSTNVKFAVCVKTVNIGVVDAYISVMNSNINVDMKCEENWVKLLKLSKDKIINKLSDLGYMVGVKVDKKQEEMNLVECNKFFEDSDFARINFKV